MNGRFYIATMFIVAFSTILVSQASAQPPTNQPAYRPPTVSPYLNLLRRGAGPGFNYFTLVRPELDFRGAIRQLQMGLGDLRRQQQLLEQEEAMPVTGHPTYFMNTGWYFNVGPRQGLVVPGVSPSMTQPVRRPAVVRFR
ncbi:MAG: hypothetical protein NZM42_09090 [Gemmatales bacterium]|nr:hypothetical protein [Gemmatales bacterium]MDW8223701.1 hypothetical protein [Gemmatales bacterium]